MAECIDGLQLQPGAPEVAAANHDDADSSGTEGDNAPQTQVKCSILKHCGTMIGVY